MTAGVHRAGLGRRAVHRLATVGGFQEVVQVSTIVGDQLDRDRRPSRTGLVGRIASELEEDELARAGVGGLDRSFVAAARERGDFCVIVSWRGETAGFVWFTTGAAPFRPGVEVTAGPGSVVGYRSYIVRPFRRVAGVRPGAVVLASRAATERGALRIALFAAPVDAVRLDAYAAAGFQRAAMLHLLSLGRRQWLWVRGPDRDDLPCAFRLARHQGVP